MPAAAAAAISLATALQIGAAGLAFLLILLALLLLWARRVAVRYGVLEAHRAKVARWRLRAADAEAEAGKGEGLLGAEYGYGGGGAGGGAGAGAGTGTGGGGIAWDSLTASGGGAIMDKEAMMGVIGAQKASFAPTGMGGSGAPAQKSSKDLMGGRSSRGLEVTEWGGSGRKVGGGGGGEGVVAVSNPFFAGSAAAAAAGGGGAGAGGGSAASQLNSLSLQGVDVAGTLGDGGGMGASSSSPPSNLTAKALLAGDKSWQGVPYATLGCGGKALEWFMPGMSTLGMGVCSDAIPDRYDVTSPNHAFKHMVGQWHGGAGAGGGGGGSSSNGGNSCSSSSNPAAKQWAINSA